MTSAEELFAAAARMREVANATACSCGGPACKVENWFGRGELMSRFDDDSRVVEHVHLWSRTLALAVAAWLEAEGLRIQFAAATGLHGYHVSGDHAGEVVAVVLGRDQPEIAAQSFSSIWRNPPEPTGLGAVIETFDGELYIRDKTTTTVAHWKRARGQEGGKRHRYDDLRVVKVLGAGTLMPLGPDLATADDVIEGRARYADTPGGHADRRTREAERRLCDRRVDRGGDQ